MRSLRARLTIAAVITSALLLIVGTLLVAADVSARLNQAIDADLAHRFADVASAVRAGAYEVIAADPLTQVVTLDGQLEQRSILPGQVALLTPAEVRDAAHATVVADHGNVRLRAERQGDHIVVVGTSSDALHAVRNRERLVLLALIPTLVALAGLGAWVLVGATLRPVTAMAREAERLSVHDPARRLPEPSGDDEVGALARNLNALLDRVHETMAADRALVDNASHELRTPLGVLRGELELAQLNLADLPRTEVAVSGLDAPVAAVADSLARAHNEVARLGRLTEDLLTLARFDRDEAPLRLRAVDVRKLADELVERLGRPGTQLLVDGPHVLVNADRDRLEQVLTNLVGNAIRHARTRVRLTVADLGGDGVEIVVADDGNGFPERLLPHVFERFRRADLARRRTASGDGPDSGTGLGMAIVATIVAAHHATITAGNGAPLGGAVVTVRLPVAPSVTR